MDASIWNSTRGQVSNNIYDNIKGVALFFGVKVVGVVNRKRSSKLLKKSGIGTSCLTRAPVCLRAVERNMETTACKREMPPPILQESACRSEGGAPHSLPECGFCRVPARGQGDLDEGR